MEPFTLEEVIQHLESGAFQLRAAIDTGVFPAALLHSFACDCAQRALIWERHLGIDTDVKCWKATGVKRLWIEEKATKEELIEIHQTVRKLAEETDSTAAWACAWASSDSPMLAARCAAHYASGANKPKGQDHPVSFLWNRERLWQIDRFVWLFKAWSACGDRMPWMIREGSLPIEEPELVKLSAGITEPFEESDSKEPDDGFE